VHERSPVVLTEAERADISASVDSQIRRLGEPGIRPPPSARAKPLINRVVVADDGRVFVRVNAPSQRVGRQWVEPVVFDVFDATHRYLGTFNVPTGFRLVRVVGDRVWGVYRDQDGVEVVQRYRVEFLG